MQISAALLSVPSPCPAHQAPPSYPAAGGARPASVFLEQTPYMRASRPAAPTTRSPLFRSDRFCLVQISTPRPAPCDPCPTSPHSVAPHHAVLRLHQAMFSVWSHFAAPDRTAAGQSTPTVLRLVPAPRPLPRQAVPDATIPPPDSSNPAARLGALCVHIAQRLRPVAQ